ncbi:hypothetical protein AMJ87_03220 [candidate division WOR_3 bacterium SM23_60]|uniref:Fibronectin type-III domain-containing protein n=1 Tax=candidate division WOR_3 bacterium SM23_60 TaxID=1703780 RepID=A0A0S8GMC0_UNCW3|nr:MAG: hypothetical protein AMJ87_03220 [candidate division WOR_3 bacterium SM23_60]
MKRHLLAVVFGFALIHAVFAKPVLVTVELSDPQDIQQWLTFEFPTYDFLEKTAIAEIDDTQMRVLVEAGFAPVIIDESPWQEKYFLLNVPQTPAVQLPGRIIWQKGTVSLRTVLEEDVVMLYSQYPNPQPLRRSELPARFWQQYLITLVPLRTLTFDPFIQNLVDAVSTDSITAYIQRLQDFKTRLMLTDSSYAASAWLKQKYTGWGYDTEFDSFYTVTSWPGSGWERNVIATTYGSEHPSTIYIICGHFDAIVWHDTAAARYNAPGADDNATGTVAAMEAARIFKDYSWESTMQFIGWAAEELGLIGAYHYANRADSLGIDIGGVVNNDMIGYMDDADYDVIVQRRDSQPLWLSDLYEQAGALYVPSLIIYPVTSGGGSDWYPFALRGYASVGGAENAGTHWNPYYHDTLDLLSTLTPEFYTMATQVSVATMGILGTYPAMVMDVAVDDVGDGSSLMVHWTANTESDIVGYTVYWGQDSEVYTDSHFVAGVSITADTISGLMTDSTYYIIVRAHDDDAHESYLAQEQIGSPRLVPAAPNAVTATPIVSGVRIDWQPNTELDLAGYRVYCRINDETEYDSLNTSLLLDTTLTDAPLSGENKYYYTVRAFDEAGNPSPMSDEAYGRPVTLDQGILVVDETKNWTTGSFPADSAQDAFYQYIMDIYDYTEYDYGATSERVVLADMVPYSTVVWHADDFSELFAAACIEDMQAYLDFGGNLWFVGWKPTANLRESQTYPADFSPGDFVYDYFKIAHAELSASSDSFQRAVGQLGYTDLDVDAAKVPIASWGETMRSIEALTSVAPAEDIYTIDMENNSSPFEGEVCAVRYLGNDFNTVFFGFPLYYMDQDQARIVAQKVMSDFGELSVEERPQVGGMISGLLLQQNTPNPFVSQTVIRYQVAHAGDVRLRIYNSAGQLVKTLVSTTQSSGSYTTHWFGQDNQGKRVASGVYFMQLTVADRSIVKKITLLR